MTKSGVQVEDVRLKRIISLAAQKFISDIAGDALQYSKIRQQGAPSSKDKRATQRVSLMMFVSYVTITHPL